MNQRQLSVIASVGALALITVVAEIITAPQAVLVVLGVLLVFVLPGYAAVCAVIPGRDLSLGERLMASVASSLAITTVLAVLLAASPIGLGKGSIAATLGIGTAVLSLYAWVRARRLLDEVDARAPGRVAVDSGRRDHRWGQRDVGRS